MITLSYHKGMKPLSQLPKTLQKYIKGEITDTGLVLRRLRRPVSYENVEELQNLREAYGTRGWNE